MVMEGGDGSEEKFIKIQNFKDGRRARRQVVKVAERPIKRPREVMEGDDGRNDRFKKFQISKIPKFGAIEGAMEGACTTAVEDAVE
mmetsp:Transcript_22724/g.45462  ORF Transcript_22724/g.45462 Transcript_22724/m.45462 type:complete len:86 (+) Transcript_22724:295-552(+)